MQKYSRFFFIAALFILSKHLFAGNKEKNSKGFQFTHKIEIPTTCVKDQANSGTCWSFATTSFIESEILRIGGNEVDLSEMFFVRYTYPEKATKYIRYHGMGNFSEGGQAHDVLNVIDKYGLIPEQAYSGLNSGIDYHRHGEMVDVLSGILDNTLKNKDSFSGKYLDVINASLDVYLGEIPEKFVYNKNEFTPVSFKENLNFNANDYVEFTSYSIYPFYEKVDLEVPDNWSHDLYYNVPIDDLMEIINYAFANGYSVNWDGDVSERGFSHKKGVAIVPSDETKDLIGNEQAKWETMTEKEKNDLLYDFSQPRKEKLITQKMRQDAFDKFKITDDHLMHLIGTATDQNGNLYYITKNSWADDSNKYGGKLYMSNAYIRLATVAILVHKDAVPEAIKKKLDIK